MARIASLMKMFGFDPAKGLRSALALPSYFRDMRALRSELAERTPDFAIGKLYPMLDEYSASAGVASGHYFHQDIHVARRIFESAPVRHVDIGSRIDGFVAHVAVFRPIEVADIRELKSKARNISFLRCDLMDPASVDKLGKSDSVSCLHTLEHFGLGRYGDPIRADGHVAGIANLCRMVSPGGTLYLSVPIGPQRVEFNAHRVFAARTIPSLVPGDFGLRRFSYIDDAGDFHDEADIASPAAESHFGCNFGCGIYEFTRNN